MLIVEVHAGNFHELIFRICLLKSGNNDFRNLEQMLGLRFVAEEE